MSLKIAPAVALAVVASSIMAIEGCPFQGKAGIDYCHSNQRRNRKIMASKLGLRLHIYFIAGLLVLAVAAPVSAAEVTVGANIVNPYAFSAQEQDAMLSELKRDGVRVIRVSITLDDKGVAFAERAWKAGLKIEWLIFRFGGYEPGGRPLSAADPEQFRNTFGPILSRLEDNGVTFAAFELGNEFNLAGYNSEFPRPGRGMVYGLKDLEDDPVAQQVARGYLQYLKVLAVLKDLRDHSKLNQHTPVMTAGLAVYETDEGQMPGSKTDLVSVNATLEYMRAHGLDELVDAYAVHVYPRGNGPGDAAAAAARREKLAKYVLKQCRPAGSPQGKPCWLTEWGFNNTDMRCPTNDSSRALLVREMMGNFRPYVQDGRLIGLMSYAWNDLPAPKFPPSAYTLYRCGAPTESGRLTVDAGLLK